MSSAAAMEATREVVRDVLFLGGNGHAAARLEPARASLLQLPKQRRFRLTDLEYPRASSFDELLDRLAADADAAGLSEHTTVYATGIGGLVALAQRARGVWTDVPLLMQGAVLWGLEQRTFPKLMRIGPAPYLLAALLRNGRVQRRFAHKHFLVPHDERFLQRFFAGYGDAASFAGWFDWLSPALLRRLETAFAERPEALRGVRAWWGGRDSVVGVEELERTEAALGMTIPCTVHAGWGHYPMIDDPDGWVAELDRALA